MKIFLTLFLYLTWFTTIESPEIIQPPKTSELKLNGFNVRDAYEINKKESFVIASQITEDKTDYEGLRLLYLRNNKIEFISNDVDESYFYRPTFYKFKDSTILIICEKGFEYFAGIDVFEFSNGNILMLGNIDVASVEKDNTKSVVPNLMIEHFGETYNFKFKGEVIINPGGIKEDRINGDSLLAKYHPGVDKISLMIKQ